LSLTFVGALHVALIYALATGLAARFVTQHAHELTAKIIEPEQPKEQPPPPVEANLAKPALPSVDVPQIKIEQQQVPQHAITTIVAPPTPPAPAPVVAAPPAPPGPTPASGITRTHTIPPYPPTSLRLGEQGTVQLRIDIATDGSVSDASVVESSGSSTLDEAAVAWVKDHWRYKPATEEGHAVSSTVEAAVVFNLKHAG
jgi:protein TonB